MTRPARALVLAAAVVLLVLSSLLAGTGTGPTAMFGPKSAAAQVTADLSDHLIAITTGFTGADLLLFGAVETEGTVVVVVRGPRTPLVVRRKGRVVGIWVNQANMTFDNVPGYYAVAASGPLDEIPDAVRARHEIGANFLQLKPPAGAEPDRVKVFRQALIRNMQEDSLYSLDPAPILFLGRQLFRVDIRFPADAPVGRYEVAVYLIRDGEVINAQSTPLQVSKIGFEAWIFDFAHRHALPYGVLAILIAVVAGWGASVLFRKD